jgi:L-ascorbate metabolism protein UlaG (beta-lactamase superfamily)
MKPQTLEQIRNIAEFMFNDKAIVSVEIEATWGTVVVYQDGTIKAVKLNHVKP